jgi:hypothetical protein
MSTERIPLNKKVTVACLETRHFVESDYALLFSVQSATDRCAEFRESSSQRQNLLRSPLDTEN